jgi:uncharacterized protein YegP (UPF0339 family)
MRAEIYKDAAGEWRWRLKADGNYKKLADSGEGYTSREGALYGLSLVTQSVLMPQGTHTFSLVASGQPVPVTVVVLDD